MTIKSLAGGIHLHMIGTHFCVLQSDDLANLTSSGFNTMNPFNLYMIARRPRIMLNPTSVKVIDELISGQFTIKKEETIETHDFTLLNQLGTSQIRFESPTPNNMFYVYDENEHLLAMGNTANLVPLCREPFDELLDLEVMYIGQPWGIEGVSTNPAKILDLHAIQQICSDILQRSTDHEVWFILWSFQEMPDSSNFNIDLLTDEEETELLKTAIERKLSAQQCINFTEAALIRYFKPEYNNSLNHDFGNGSIENYSDCASTEVTSVTVEINTEEISSSLWSPGVDPFCMHYAEYTFNSPDEMKELFKFKWAQD